MSKLDAKDLAQAFCQACEPVNMDMSVDNTAESVPLPEFGR